MTYATEDSYLGHDWVFAYGSIVAMGLAVLRARFLDADVFQLAVWDGVETQGMAGTGYDVRTWRDAGRPLEVIASGASADRPAPAATAAPADGGQRELKAMLFGDVRGFSKLTDAQIPTFVSQMLSTVGKVLSGYGDRVLYRNTWGDGLFVVLDDAPAAAQCALDLQAAMAAIDLHACRLPETLALRLGGHFGPVFEATDPVLHVTNYFGTHVSRTARIEPVTRPARSMSPNSSLPASRCSRMVMSATMSAGFRPPRATARCACTTCRPDEFSGRSQSPDNPTQRPSCHPLPCCAAQPSRRTSRSIAPAGPVIADFLTKPRQQV